VDLRRIGITRPTWERRKEGLGCRLSSRPQQICLQRVREEELFLRVGHKWSNFGMLVWTPTGSWCSRWSPKRREPAKWMYN